MVTIKEVAERAGVSPATVSRVINNRGWVSEEKVELVRDAIKEVGYKRNEMARSLRLGKTGMIGLLFFSPEDVFQYVFFSQVLLGVASELEARDYGLVVSTIKVEEKGLKVPTMCNYVDGLIVSGFNARDSMYKELENVGAMVVIGQHFPNKQVIRVRVDNEQNAKQAVNELIRIGKKNLALVTGSSQMYAFRDVINGFKDACVQNNICYEEENIFEVESLEHLNYLFEFLTKMKERNVDGLIIGHVTLTRIVSQFLKSMNISVPEDLAIIAFCDEKIEPSDVEFPYVHADGKQLGIYAVRLLMDLIQNNQHPSSITLERRMYFPDYWKDMRDCAHDVVAIP